MTARNDYDLIATTIRNKIDTYRMAGIPTFQLEEMAYTLACAFMFSDSTFDATEFSLFMAAATGVSPVAL